MKNKISFQYVKPPYATIGHLSPSDSKREITLIERRYLLHLFYATHMDPNLCFNKSFKPLRFYMKSYNDREKESLAPISLDAYENFALTGDWKDLSLNPPLLTATTTWSPFLILHYDFISINHSSISKLYLSDTIFRIRSLMLHITD